MASASPAVAPVTAQMALKPAFQSSLNHRSRTIWAESVTSHEGATSAWTARARSVRPAGSPMSTRPSAWWCTVPGATTSSPTNAMPPSTWSAGTNAAIRPTFSTPFCSERTLVRGGDDRGDRRGPPLGCGATWSSR